MHKQADNFRQLERSRMTAMTSKELGISTPAEKAAAAQRRDATKRVRWVRDRLTSTSGTPAFDYELLRQFAQNRLSASLAIWLLIATVGFLSGLWTGIVPSVAWTLVVFGIHTIIASQCRKFLDGTTAAASTSAAGACASSCSTCASASPGCRT